MRARSAEPHTRSKSSGCRCLSLTLKSDVQLKQLDPRMVLADLVVYSIFAKHGLDCQVTSGTDGQHKPGSLHGKGEAHDYGTRLVPNDVLPTVVMEVAAALPGYDVIYEGPVKPDALPGYLYLASPQPHLHVEFDPPYIAGG